MVDNERQINIGANISATICHLQQKLAFLCKKNLNFGKQSSFPDCSTDIIFWRKKYVYYLRRSCSGLVQTRSRHMSTSISTSVSKKASSSNWQYCSATTCQLHCHFINHFPHHMARAVAQLASILSVTMIGGKIIIAQCTLYLQKHRASDSHSWQ